MIHTHSLSFETRGLFCIQVDTWQTASLFFTRGSKRFILPIHRFFSLSTPRSGKVSWYSPSLKHLEQKATSNMLSLNLIFKNRFEFISFLLRSALKKRGIYHDISLGLTAPSSQTSLRDWLMFLFSYLTVSSSSMASAAFSSRRLSSTSVKVKVNKTNPPTSGNSGRHGCFECP